MSSSTGIDRSRGARSAAGPISSYWERTRWPLQSLYFLLPLIVLYEVGIVLWVEAVDIRARGLLQLLFEHLGVTGVYLPGLVVVVVLLAWHMMDRGPWRPEPKLYGLMWLESLVLTVPLLVFATVLVREPAVQAIHSLAAGNTVEPTAVGDWRARLILPIGAGIYEELVFRLIALALLHLLLVDLLGLAEQYGSMIAVVVSSVAFALYHFPSFEIHWGRFAFYTMAGLYFAAIYLSRGFGIVVAVHALYNVLVALLAMWQDHPH